MPNRSRRGWISRRVAFNGVQARMKVAGQEFSESFSASKYGSLRKAEVSARTWLDELAAALPSRRATTLRRKPHPRKHDKSLPVGISESVDTLRSGRESSRFQVCWNDGNRQRIKSFTIGCTDVATEADRRAALKKATSFRKRYEQCRKAGTEFDPRDA